MNKNNNMPKLKQKRKKPLREINQPANVLQTNKVGLLHHDGTDTKTPESIVEPTTNEGLSRVSSLLENENQSPTVSALSNSSTDVAGTSSLYLELDSFRQKWKRELAQSKSNHIVEDVKPSTSGDTTTTIVNNTTINTDPKYTEAKRLFLIAVDLETNDKHHESIQYYKKSMHLCPDIEKEIFREQCEASKGDIQDVARVSGDDQKQQQEQEESDVNIYERVLQRFNDDSENQNYYSHCKPHQKVKSGTSHISDLPHELLVKIFRHIVGSELDLASLEQLGMVCRGFYLMSRDKSLWKDICFNTWFPDTLGSLGLKKNSSDIDWRQMFLERPRVNFDGVYISRTRYFRQGDVGFQDITYRPFHVVHYYRYLRFFPDRRVLILTTNEEPEKIVPIFRHALNAKQFSSELSIMEGIYEFSSTGCNQIYIKAEKKSRQFVGFNQHQGGYNRRQAAEINLWSRQTPIAQSFNLNFELKTVENRPHRNNVLKWLDYTIMTKLVTGQELTTFDLSPDTFPSLLFSRVKRFNLRSANPLSSH